VFFSIHNIWVEPKLGSNNTAVLILNKKDNEKDSVSSINMRSEEESKKSRMNIMNKRNRD